MRASGSPFVQDEYAGRVRRVRSAMREQDLGGLLVTTPENIYYLIGLNHQGYFAFSMLVLPAAGSPVLVARAMEIVTIGAQTPGIEFLGYGEGDDVGTAAARAVALAGCADQRVGLDASSMFFPPGVWIEMEQRLPGAEWIDTSASFTKDPTFKPGLVDHVRMVKTPAEIRAVRRSAAISDAAMTAALDVAATGVNEIEIAAAIYEAAIRSGGEYPAFAPFVRSSETLLEEHTTWRDHELATGEQLFLELSGSYARYHAPLGRTAFVGSAPDGSGKVRQVAVDAIEAARSALNPGAISGDVYQAWQDTVDEGLGHDRLRRHHCGYIVGIGFPPSWTGSTVLGLRPGGKVPIEPGMVFHLWAWISDEHLGEYLLSESALVTDAGAELLTKADRPHVIR